jgi:MYXO-CTERM domain-containing protein
MRTRSLLHCVNLGLALALPACADDGGWPTSPEGVDQEAIVGGKADTTSHAVIGIITKEGELCSGSLILPNLVLTARHCVAALQSDSVQCGVTMFGAVHPASDFAISWDANLRDNIDMSTVYHATSIKTPPDPGVCGNDIALIELSSNVPADQAVPLVPRLDTPPMVNETFSAVGYGITNPNDQAGNTAGQRMRYDGAKVSCVGSACGANVQAASNEFNGQAPVCSGDSGGPALDAQGQVIGATSRGPQPCNFAIYSEVSAWKSFITDGATTAVNDGGYDPPGWVTGMPTSSGGMSSGGATSTSGGGRSGGGDTSGSGGARASGAGAPGAGGTPAGVGGMRAFGGAGGRRQGFGMSGAAGTPPGAGGVTSFGGEGGRAAGAGTSGGAGVPSAAAGMYSFGGAGGRPGAAGAPATNAGRAGSNSGTHSGNLGGNGTAADSGCGCRTAPSIASTRAAWWPAFAALFAAAALRRRTRRNEPRATRGSAP